MQSTGNIWWLVCERQVFIADLRESRRDILRLGVILRSQNVLLCLSAVMIRHVFGKARQVIMLLFLNMISSVTGYF